MPQIKGSGQEVHLCSISHVWESMEHPDPYKFQLQKMIEPLETLHGEVWIFLDFISLYQYKRTGDHQEESFRRALEVMHVFYANDHVHVELLKELTPAREKASQNEEQIEIYDETTSRILALLQVIDANILYRTRICFLLPLPNDCCCSPAA